MGDRSSSPMKVTSQASDFNQGGLAKELVSMEWTNEKHNMYLKSMEASFVNDLYNSLDLLGYQENHFSDAKSSRRKYTPLACGQFKILQRGCWEKIHFERNRSRSQKTDDAGVLLASPWIRHFRSSCGRQTVGSSTHQEAMSATDLASYDSAEVTDQNFVDEEDTADSATDVCSPKRIKTSIARTPTNDQVVPLDDFLGSADVTSKSSQ